MSDRNTVGFRWVLKQYQPSDEKAKSILANAKQGLGYYLINRERENSDPIIVAFRYPDFKPFMAGMVEASPEQVEKLERLTKRQ